MSITDSERIQIIETIRSVSLYDFSEYSDKSLKRRFTKILMDYRISTDELLRQLKAHPKFVEEVIKKVTVNTTELFRDPQVWLSLKNDILPKFADKPLIRIWHAGCSTGQEVYSMVMLLSELGLLDRTELYATDLNTDVMDTAKKGTYKYKFNISYMDNFDKVIRGEKKEDIPYEKYMELDLASDKIRINQSLLEKPIYAKHDLVNDDNIFHVAFDLILCRNVIIYFNYTLQNKVFQLFYDSLCENGFLVLGVHESILGQYTTKFEKRGYYYLRK